LLLLLAFPPGALFGTPGTWPAGAAGVLAPSASFEITAIRHVDVLFLLLLFSKTELPSNVWYFT